MECSSFTSKKEERTDGVVKSAMNCRTTGDTTLNAVQVQRSLRPILLLEFAVIEKVCGTERTIAISRSKIDRNGSIEGWGRQCIGLSRHQWSGCYIDWRKTQYTHSRF